MVKNVYIVDEAASAVNLLDNTTSSASTTNATSTIDLTQNSTQPTFQQIAAGSSKTYALYGTIAGFTTGGTLSISIAADTSSTSTAPNVNHTAGLTTPFGATLDSVVWSDRSANSHTLTTSDWINGYLLQNFTSNATTYSK